MSTIANYSFFGAVEHSFDKAANFTKWEPSRITKAMEAAKSGLTLLPTSIHTTAIKPPEKPPEVKLAKENLEALRTHLNWPEAES